MHTMPEYQYIVNKSIIISEAIVLKKDNQAIHSFDYSFYRNTKIND